MVKDPMSRLNELNLCLVDILLTLVRYYKAGHPESPADGVQIKAFVARVRKRKCKIEPTGIV